MSIIDRRDLVFSVVQHLAITTRSTPSLAICVAAVRRKSCKCQSAIFAARLHRVPPPTLAAFHAHACPRCFSPSTIRLWRRVWPFLLPRRRAAAVEKMKSPSFGLFSMIDMANADNGTSCAGPPSSSRGRASKPSASDQSRPMSSCRLRTALASGEHQLECAAKRAEIAAGLPNGADLHVTQHAVALDLL